MLELIIGTNTDRNRVVVSPTSTLRQALEDNDIDITVGTLHMDGVTLRPGDIDKTFSDFGITTKCSLVNVVKGDAAAF